MTSTRRDTVIMVVDDVPANVRLLGGILRAQGYQVHEHTGGSEALAAAAADPPDLILLDIMMPELDGYAVCERLQADSNLASIPVIFLSSLSDPADKVRAFQAGGVDYITKPFEISEVQARVETHLKIRRLQRELEQQNRMLVESNERLRELEELRDNLVHMIVHDLKNPLQEILMYLELLRETEKGQLTEAGAKSLRQLVKSADFLLELISSVLDVSRLESGQMPLQPTACDLGSLAGEVVSRLEAQRGERELALELPEEPVLVRGDAQLLSRLIQNLAGNALKFTPGRGGRVRIALAAGDSRVRCTVRDNGPGVRPEHREKVFEKFWLGEARKQGHRYSSGLGLTFCKMVVEAHGGKIGVESGPGQGSTFWFELPASGPGDGRAAEGDADGDRG